MPQQDKKLPSFFRPLFWSYDFSAIGLQQDKKRIIINTINYGDWKHWLWIFDYYGKKEVREIIKETPQSEFRKQALQLACLLLNIKKIKYASRSAYIKSKKDFPPA